MHDDQHVWRVLRGCTGGRNAWPSRPPHHCSPAEPLGPPQRTCQADDLGRRGQVLQLGHGRAAVGALQGRPHAGRLQGAQQWAQEGRQNSGFSTRRSRAACSHAQAAGSRQRQRWAVATHLVHLAAANGEAPPQAALPLRGHIGLRGEWAGQLLVPRGAAGSSSGRACARHGRGRRHGLRCWRGREGEHAQRGAPEVKHILHAQLTE